MVSKCYLGLKAPIRRNNHSKDDECLSQQQMSRKRKIVISLLMGRLSRGMFWHRFLSGYIDTLLRRLSPVGAVRLAQEIINKRWSSPGPLIPIRWIIVEPGPDDETNGRGGVIFNQLLSGWLGPGWLIMIKIIR